MGLHAAGYYGECADRCTYNEDRHKQADDSGDDCDNRNNGSCLADPLGVALFLCSLREYNSHNTKDDRENCGISEEAAYNSYDTYN